MQNILIQDGHPSRFCPTYILSTRQERKCILSFGVGCSMTCCILVSLLIFVTRLFVAHIYISFWKVEQPIFMIFHNLPSL